MCLVTEHIRLKVELATAKDRIKELESQIPKPIPTPLPIERKVLTGQQVYNIIREKFLIGEIFISDSWDESIYSLCDISDIEAFLDIDETNHIKYTKKFDCDNFTRRLYGNLGIPEWASFAIGLLWSDIHAMVICIDSNEDLWIVEPQTDERRSDLLEWQGTTMRFVII